MNADEKLLAAIATLFISGLALIAWGAGFGKLAALFCGAALVFITAQIFCCHRK